ncbi:glycosyltransferase family 4 protein [Rhodospirillum rubrum]|uniref:Glycosyl transferase, group 1 n=1 Tax=Rhodospirillum rubrum (strain ATCC 11170 / ATH 1.1.1 / DSM 467 / LMG 4362 / NCIMB 8255 / S1) TaxID=269796 RepID=Q2RNX5_RHORT|nr:Glycosyl transferase, group 1 [Rhodospirillum rubrum ATCC 11170]MBK5955883.1 glycosyl transferase [Rhodospirillum rubrum]HAQ00025.1 glycosyl transferase [Rhodospirillum rubrum]HCF18935.1 glycosyl transferase [Rhodospirillum rubrum]
MLTQSNSLGRPDQPGTSEGAADWRRTGIPTVLQVLPELVTGGVERGTVDMAAALVAAGWRAVVASAGGPMVRELERVGADHITLPLKTKNPLAIRRNARTLTKLIEREGVWLVHARSRAPAWSALWAARRAGVPFVTTFHGTYTPGPFGAKLAYNKVMTQGDRVIAISHFIADHIRATYEMDDSLIRVVHRGIDIDVFNPDRVSAERMIRLCTRWRLADGAPVVMLPGRLTRWKGQSVLIEALARLKRRDVRCLLVGSDQGRVGYRDSLIALARKRGVADQVHIVDDCDDMAAAYMVTDVVVSASTDPEAFGRVVAEGQAMGRPVIAPAHGAAPEILKTGATGWLVPPGDAEALAEALDQALSMDEASRQSVAEAAIDHVRRCFSKQSMTERTLAVYGELLFDLPPLDPPPLRAVTEGQAEGAGVDDRWEGA